MFEREVRLSVQQILALIAEEREDYSRYCQLCARLKTAPDPIATAVHETKIELLTRLKTGDLLPMRTRE